MMRGFSHCLWECCAITRYCCGCCNKKSAPNYGGADLQGEHFRSDKLACDLYIEQWIAGMPSESCTSSM